MRCTQDADGAQVRCTQDADGTHLRCTQEADGTQVRCTQDADGTQVQYDSFPGHSALFSSLEDSTVEGFGEKNAKFVAKSYDNLCTLVLHEVHLKSSSGI